MTRDKGVSPQTLRDLLAMRGDYDDCSGEYKKDNQDMNIKDNVNTVNTIKDNVNQPTHYTIGGIETIDYMKAKSSPAEFQGHLRLTAIKYLSRANYKNDALEDYKKARVYLDWLIRDIETGSIK